MFSINSCSTVIWTFHKRNIYKLHILKSHTTYTKVSISITVKIIYQTINSNSLESRMMIYLDIFTIDNLNITVTRQRSIRQLNQYWSLPLQCTQALVLVVEMMPSRCCLVSTFGTGTQAPQAGSRHQADWFSGNSRNIRNIYYLQYSWYYLYIPVQVEVQQHQWNQTYEETWNGSNCLFQLTI